MAASAVHIRRASPDDMDAILALWGAMMQEHERRDPRIRLADGALAAYRAYLGYHIMNSESCVRVAEAPEGVVGFCLLTISRNLPMFLPDRYGYLSDLTVAESWRRQQVGSALVEEIRQWLRRKRVDTVQLQYYNFNAGGEAFWRAMGFEPFYTRMWLNL